MTAHDGTWYRRRWANLTAGIASRLWPIPMAAVLLGVVLGLALPELDRTVDDALPAGLATVIFSGGTESARAVLSAITGSLITATSLTFSLTVIALQLASSQASPRLLRMFSSDGLVHATLALFLGTFAYALAVLRTVSDAGDPFVPRIAVTIASLLTLTSVALLTVFLAHLASQLRVETMMRNVHRETKRSIGLASINREGGTDDIPSVPSSGTHTVGAPRSGFITGLEREELVAVAMEHDIVVRELLTVGASVISGSPVLEWWPRTQARTGHGADAAQLGDRLASTVGIDYERTPTQDVGFGLRQLVDIAIRAISPAVNDPTTAVHALGHASAILAEFDRMPPEPPSLADEHGIPRLVQHPVGFDELLELAMTQPRRYGASDPDVVARLFHTLEELGARVERRERREAIVRQLERLEASVADADYDDVERDRFARMAAGVRAAVAEHDAAMVLQE